jgi:hypothetical protein
MGQLADVLHVSFTIQPEWNLNEPLYPSAIQIEVVESRQISQFAGWSDIVEYMMTMIHNNLGVPHIMQFKPKLHQVSSGFGYELDLVMQGVMVRNIVLAQDAGLASDSPTLQHTPPIHSQPSNHSTYNNVQSNADPPSPSPMPSSGPQTHHNAQQTTSRQQAQPSTVSFANEPHPHVPTMSPVTTP